MHVSNRLIGIILLAAAVQAALLWCHDVPLGIAGEWTWPRTARDVSIGTALLTGAAAVALYAALVFAGAQRMHRAGRFEAAGWLTALFAAGCAWLWVVIETTPGPLGLGRGPFIVYYPRTSGYFLQARAGLEDWPRFLANYEQELEQGDVLHLGTHPPGLAMGYAFLLDQCREHPALTDVLLAVRPDSVVQATEQLQRNESVLRPPFGRADAACLWLASLLTLMCAVATVWPLYALLLRTVDKTAAWQLAALWPLVPAVAVFYPKSDLVFPFIAMLFAWLWLTGWERGIVWRCALAAVVLPGGLLLSLAFLPVAAIVALETLIQWFGAGRETVPQREQVSHVQRVWCLGTAIIVFAICVAAFWYACDVNLLNVWRLNFINHAGFYDQYPRTWWKWLLANPLELAVSAGAVIAVLALVGLARNPVFSKNRVSPSRRPVALSVVLVWAALWLSGKNMGEAARLWILLMPWLLIVAASLVRECGDESDTGGRKTASPGYRWLILLVAQAALCLLTAHRVDGFHFEELVP